MIENEPAELVQPTTNVQSTKVLTEESSETEEDMTEVDKTPSRRSARSLQV